MSHQVPPSTAVAISPTEIEERLRNVAKKVAADADMSYSVDFENEWESHLQRAVRRMVDEGRADESQMQLAELATARLAGALVAQARTDGLTKLMKYLIGQVLRPPLCPLWPFC